MKTAKLGDICELITRGISPKYTEDQRQGVTVLNQKCIRNKTLLYEFSRLHDIHAKSVREAKFVKPGDLLVNSTGQGTLGRTALVENIDQPLLVDSHITILRPIEGLFEPRYFAYLIGRCESDFTEMATGTSGQTELSRSLLSEYKVSYEPSVEEQRRIVARLDAIFEKVDRAIELTEENIQNTQKFLETTLASAFDSGSAWGMTSLESLGTITSSKRIYKSEYKKEGIPFYRTKEIKELANGKRVSTELFISSERYNTIREKFGVPAPGDILISAIGTIGEIYVVQDTAKFYFKDGNVLWLKDFEQINPYFLKYVLSRFVSELNKLSNGAAYSALPIQKLKGYQVPVPPNNVQEDIVKHLNNIAAQILRLSTAYQKKLDYLKALRQSLLHQAFSTTDKV